MKSLFKQLIVDFHKAALPDLVARDVQFPQLGKGVRKAFVLIGMRRSGKTWALYQQIQTLLGNRISKQQMIYLDFADDRLTDITLKDLSLILDAYYELYPQFVNSDNLYFFFDEIQEVKGWEKFIRRLLNTEKMQLYLSGSSAKMLSKEIASSLRGRTIVREIFPYSFIEYLRYYNIENSTHVTTKQQALLNHHLDAYLTYGGFPEAVNSMQSLHHELLQGYVDSVIYRDIVERYHITNVHALKQLLKYCLQNSASLISINKVYNVFKSLGYHVAKTSLYNYMDYFADSYCIFNLPAYHFSIKKSSLKPKKIYPVDQGLITAYSIKNEFEQAARFETAIYLHLRRKHQEIFYYHTENKKEIDFLVMENNKISLYQVSITLAEAATKKREISALEQAMQELDVDEGTIVTLDETGEHVTAKGIIKIVPALALVCP